MYFSNCLAALPLSSFSNCTVLVIVVTVSHRPSCNIEVANGAARGSVHFRGKIVCAKMLG